MRLTRKKRIGFVGFTTLFIILGIVCIISIDDTKTTNAACAEKDHTFPCEQQRTISAVARIGIDGALADLRERQQGEPLLRTSCHQLAHLIGNIAIDNGETPEEAFRHGDDVCFSGYYHGVMEEYLKTAGGNNMKAIITHLCGLDPSVRFPERNRMNCFHGLGHGIYAATRSDLPESLAYCDELSSDAATFCYDGVFMENVVGASAGHTRNNLKEEEPLFPCTTVSERHKASCYKRQTAFLFSQSLDYAALFKLCEGAEATMREICFRSIGHDALGDTEDDESSLGACMSGNDDGERKGCIEGYAESLVYFNLSDTEALTFCAKVPENMRVACNERVQEEWARLSR